MPFTGIPGTPGSGLGNILPGTGGIGSPVPGGNSGIVSGGVAGSLLPNTVLTATTITVYSHSITNTTGAQSTCLIQDLSYGLGNPILPPPANWFSPSFDHSSWQTAVSVGPQASPQEDLWFIPDDRGAPWNGVDQALLFDQFYLPPSIKLTSAQVSTFANNQNDGFWINGNLVPGTAAFGDCATTQTLTAQIPLNWLFPSQMNYLGSWVTNLCLFGAAGWTITINYIPIGLKQAMLP